MACPHPAWLHRPVSTIAEIGTALNRLPAAEREAFKSRLLTRRFGFDLLNEDGPTEMLSSLNTAEREIDAGQGHSDDDSGKPCVHALGSSLPHPEPAGQRIVEYIARDSSRSRRLCLWRTRGRRPFARSRALIASLTYRSALSPRRSGQIPRLLRMANFKADEPSRAAVDRDVIANF